MEEKVYAVELHEVGLTIDKQELLKDISLNLDYGKIYGIIGRNGSGKTLLFKCIAGFILPTHGDIEVIGEQIGQDTDFSGHMGVIIETPGFIPHYSAYKNLKILADISGGVKKERIIECIRMVGLDEKERKPVKKYSLGMRQRLGLAQAIMEDPHVLVLDEPMNGLDKQGVEDIRHLLLELKKQDKTILIASHNAEDIRLLCDEVYEMDAGMLTKIK
ncbi:MAG: ATP-binding cassette domain-containing protein [Lachnospiraceae bacterium]|nr:ATP-binding cassette domain-containing protein [Clostridiales bacterium]MDD5999441.1 ATP-binding cassette domain-containing protein [Lachnospiraceae bacterium]